MLRLSSAFLLSMAILFAAASTSSAASIEPAASASTSEPGWLGVVVARGELKQWIDATPIVDRPNRPFHFYGNAVRRQYYRGNSLPRPSDWVKSGAALINNRP
jgi:hypothetical protein